MMQSGGAGEFASRALTISLCNIAVYLALLFSGLVLIPALWGAISYRRIDNVLISCDILGNGECGPQTNVTELQNEISVINETLTECGITGNGQCGNFTNTTVLEQQIQEINNTLNECGITGEGQCGNATNTTILEQQIQEINNTLNECGITGEGQCGNATNTTILEQQIQEINNTLNSCGITGDGQCGNATNTTLIEQQIQEINNTLNECGITGNGQCGLPDEECWLCELIPSPNAPSLFTIAYKFAVVSYDNLNTTVLSFSGLNGGAIVRANDNSSIAYGDDRGYYAFDLQEQRTATNQVASGNNSFIGPGQNNRASGDYGTILGGYNNSESGQFNLVYGKNNVVTNQSHCTVFGKNLNCGLQNNTVLNATSIPQTIVGQYNNPEPLNTGESVIFQVGSGSDDESRQNAMSVTDANNVYIGIGGNVFIEGVFVLQYMGLDSKFLQKNSNLQVPLPGTPMCISSEGKMKFCSIDEYHSAICVVSERKNGIILNAAEHHWHGKYLNDRKLNPAYDEKKMYVPRKHRVREYVLVSCKGEVEVIVGEPVPKHWIPLSDKKCSLDRHCYYIP